MYVSQQNKHAYSMEWCENYVKEWFIPNDSTAFKGLNVVRL